MSRAAPSLPTSAPRPGEILSGVYRVEHALGAGGMGYVLAVTRLADDAPFAIKMLNPDLAEDPQIVARFLHEARAAQAVTSEHVCRVFDVGTMPSGTPYLVMERLEGTDLATWLDRNGPVPFVQAVDWMLEACEALAEAHAQRYVHRDLKPSNLFLADRDGQSIVKVLDFGIAKSLNTPKHSKLTTTSAILGSPSYMSPEQLRSSKNVDVHSDIWSLGVVLYELITGAVPFDAPTLPDLSVLILTGAPIPVSVRDATVPKELSDVIAACLRREPARRFGNLAELATHLMPFGTSFARASADRVVAILGMPATRVVLESSEAFATTAETASRSAYASGHEDVGLPPRVVVGSSDDAFAATVQSSPRLPETSDHGAAVTMPEKARATRSMWTMVVFGGAIVAGALAFFLKTNGVGSRTQGASGDPSAATSFFATSASDGAAQIAPIAEADASARALDAATTEGAPLVVHPSASAKPLLTSAKATHPSGAPPTSRTPAASTTPPTPSASSSAPFGTMY